MLYSIKLYYQTMKIFHFDFCCVFNFPHVHDLKVSIRNFDRLSLAQTRYLSFSNFFFFVLTRGEERHSTRDEFSHQLSAQKFRQVQATVLHFPYIPLSSLLYLYNTYRARTLALIENQSYVYFCNAIAVIYNYTCDSTRRY